MEKSNWTSERHSDDTDSLDEAERKALHLLLEEEVLLAEEGIGRGRTHPARGIDNMTTWAGTPSIRGGSESMRMALLTFSLVGLQFSWGIEMTYCTPYLLSLGLTKSKTSLVWIAGPLSGLIMAPLIGVLADRSRSKYGRRRPFMVLGSVMVCLCLLVLGWTKEIVGHFVPEGELNKSCTIYLAVLAIYAVDFAINAVQWSCRSLIVDTLPISKQQSGSAWASRMAAMGHWIGYAIGAFDLVSMFGKSMGDTQFKKLILIAAGALLFSVGVTSYAVTERILISSKESDAQAGLYEIARRIFVTARDVPPKIQAIFWAQFWSWIGWFPLLFYGATFVGETYFRFDAPHDIRASQDALGDIGRIGSMSLVVFSAVSFAGSFILPLIIKSPDEAAFTARPPRAIAGLVTTLNKYKPDLVGAWFVGHLMFSAAMLLAPFATSFRFATSLMAFCGVPWAIASWAPFTFLGIEVNKMTAVPAHTLRPRRLSSSTSSPTSPSLLRLEHGLPNSDDTASTGELSGIYFGILNIYTTVPQFIATFISMIVFAIVEPGHSPELGAHHAAAAGKELETDGSGANGIAVCMFIGALSTLGAAYATKKLRDLS